MEDVLPQLAAWLAAGESVVTATLVAVERSAPRPPGTMMAVNSKGEVQGSVSGGCVEGALYEEMMDLLAKGGPPRQISYGISDEDAFAVGLSCGGTIHLFLEPITALAPLLPRIQRAIAVEEAVVLATVLSGEHAGAKLLMSHQGLELGSGDATLDQAVSPVLASHLRQGETGRVTVATAEGDVQVFLQAFVPPPRLYVFGAIDIARAMVRIGKFLGYRVILCDARDVFATRERFPEADEIVVAWPHRYLREADVGERDAIAVLTHDAKFDVPVLAVALETPAAYIGALGSRRTHEARLAELRRQGVAEEALARIAAPAGLDIGGRTPEETALSIAAELVALRHGRSGGRLSLRPAPTTTGG
jgi:xanthine dehydrogenase accessory factor